MTNYCPICGKPLPPGKKFCSKEHELLWKRMHNIPSSQMPILHPRHRPKTVIRRVTKTCPICGRQFTIYTDKPISRKYCSKTCLRIALSLNRAKYDWSAIEKLIAEQGWSLREAERRLGIKHITMTQHFRRIRDRLLSDPSYVQVLKRQGRFESVLKILCQIRSRTSKSAEQMIKYRPADLESICRSFRESADAK